MDLENEANKLRSNLLALGVAVAPLHEWLAGEVNYFLGQGFTEREARAMAAATYVSVFGANMHSSGSDGQPGAGTAGTR